MAKYDKGLARDILDHLRENSGVRFSSGEIEDFARHRAKKRYNGETGRKRADDLFEDGLISREVNEKLRYYWVSGPDKVEVRTFQRLGDNGQMETVEIKTPIYN